MLSILVTDTKPSGGDRVWRGRATAPPAKHLAPPEVGRDLFNFNLIFYF